MRLRQRDLKTYVVKERLSRKEDDGTTYEDWSPTNQYVNAKILPASGSLMPEIYGERIARMLTAWVATSPFVEQLTREILSEEKIYGICILSNVPDYKIVNVMPWDGHVVFHLEKVSL